MQRTDYAQEECNSIQQQTKVDVKVNREYDKDGNLVEFDSTYTSYYSNIEEDSAKVDSIMHNFRKYFDNEYSMILRNHLSNLMSDSAWYSAEFRRSFFKDDFFNNQFAHNEVVLQNIFNEMDSLKNVFFYYQSK